MNRNHQFIGVILILLGLLCPSLAYGQEGNYQTILLSGSGKPINANVAICTTGLTTTAASVTNNIATLTFSSNPITAGFLATEVLTVSGFTGGDTYFNGHYTISAVSATTISFALTHANASAGTNGLAFQTGDSTHPCAPLATIFTDYTGGTVTSNPFTSGNLGNVSVWSLSGNYNMQSYGLNVVTTVTPFNIGLQSLGAASLTSLTMTGDILPGTAACCSVGSGALPFLNFNVGGSANKTAHLHANVLTADSQVDFPDVNFLIPTGSAGVPVNLVTQGAAKGITTIFTPTTTGLFRVSAYLKVTTVDAVSSTVGPVTITYTDGSDSIAQSNVIAMQGAGGTFSVTGNAANTTATTSSGTLVINALVGVPIQYTIGYISNTPGQMKYEAHIRVEPL